MNTSSVDQEARYDPFGSEITLGSIFYYADYCQDIYLGVVIGFTPSFIRYKGARIEENFDKEKFLQTSDHTYKISNSKVAIIPNADERWKFDQVIQELRDGIQAMKDVTGREIKIDDFVSFVQPGRHIMAIGMVTGFTPKNIKVKNLDVSTGFDDEPVLTERPKVRSYPHTVRPNFVTIINETVSTFTFIEAPRD